MATDWKISTDVLAYWGLACRRASAGNYSCWAQLHDKGMIVTMIGPAGDRAELPVQWSDLAQMTETRGVIDEIIHMLRKNLKMQSSILMPN